MPLFGSKKSLQTLEQRPSIANTDLDVSAFPQVQIANPDITTRTGLPHSSDAQTELIPAPTDEKLAVRDIPKSILNQFFPGERYAMASGLFGLAAWNAILSLQGGDPFALPSAITCVLGAGILIAHKGAHTTASKIQNIIATCLGIGYSLWAAGQIGQEILGAKSAFTLNSGDFSYAAVPLIYIKAIGFGRRKLVPEAVALGTAVFFTLVESGAVGKIFGQPSLLDLPAALLGTSLSYLAIKSSSLKTR